MGDQHTVAAEFQKSGQYFFDGRRVDHHLVADAGQLLDLEGNGLFRIHKGTEPLCDLSFFHLHRPDLDDPVVDRGQAGGLQVKNHKRTIQALASGIFHHFL